MNQAGSKATIHILGGGPSGLSTAFHLTSPDFNPDWRDRYRVVVHQLGWRLGGKGATGRNAEMGDRIEEHGIHLFGNMYANALHMMNSAYGELGTGDMADEFEPSNTQLVSTFRHGGWQGYGGSLPHNDGTPWETSSAIATPEQLFESLKVTVEGILQGQVLARPGMGPQRQPNLLDRLESVGHTAFIGLTSALSEGIHRLFHHEHENPLERLLEEAAHVISRLERQVEHSDDEVSDLAFWMLIQIDLIATCIRGTLDDGVLTDGIDVIDHVPYREWLETHGCHALTLGSGLPQAIPNTCMSYPMGNTTGLPTMAASAYLTFVLRQLLAPGNAAYFFKVSTGETIILPIYDALVQRGVEFEFFHKVTNVVPSADGSRVEAIVYEQQARTHDGSPYQPVRTLDDGQRVWPNAPLYDQLTEGDTWRDHQINPESWWADWTGEETTLLLEPGDQVVVALPPAVQRLVCKEASDAKAPWKTMLAEVRSTPTEALQLWTKASTEELGWPKLPALGRWMSPTFLPPLFAVADFSRSLPYENWPADGPKGLLYFCGPLQLPDPEPGFDDHDFPARMKQQVFGQVSQLMLSLANLLPEAGKDTAYPQALNPDLLWCAADDSATGINRMRQQYYRANIDPNERYTLSEPGKLKYRLKAWESGYDNVALSSDAIYTGFNIGSFEGSVMSGMLASAALVGSPTIDQVIGYRTFHPDATGPDHALVDTGGETAG
ncbi:MAG: NAD(P)-binding protein [Actinomycetota bacterium]